MLTATQQRQIRTIVGQLRARQTTARELGDRDRDLHKLQVDARGQIGRAEQALARAESPYAAFSTEERTRERAHCAQQVAQARRALTAIEAEIAELKQRQSTVQTEARQIAPIAETLIQRISDEDQGFRELVDLPGNPNFRRPRQLGAPT